MKKIGLFWGSDTGMTEEIVNILVDSIGQDQVDSINVFNASIEQFAAYDTLILGLSTWYDGELQSDWDEFFEQFQQVDFSGKTVALFGLGDQEGYAEFFIDGVGIIGKVVQQNGGTIVGKWSTKGYDYEASKAVVEEGFFMGLAIDEDNQPQQTDERLEQWIAQLKEEGLLDS
ncbi:MULTISPECIES: flavodoxin [unclassified Aureispira]|uniref:flavodoxin n=1 Tax=unclassified Aureispira TaxID=2649989 RepID=UPI0006981203|nr:MULTISPECIES: flavodoxin [unclassified Aureispira]WMX13911.1 flavodoxin [Aureispira sp. CCB-E]